MTKYMAAILFVTATACGGGSKPDTTPEPVAEKPNPVEPAPVEPVVPEPPPFELAIGELVIYDGAEPGFKLHADGTSELSAKVTKSAGKGKKKKPVTTREWKAGPTFKTDGTVEIEGKVMGTIGRDGVTDAESGQQILAYKLGADSLTVSTPDGDVTLQLVPEGVKAVGGPMDGRVDKIEASDEKVKVTALLIIALNSAGGPPDEPTAATSAPATK